MQSYTIILNFFGLLNEFLFCWMVGLFMKNEKAFGYFICCWGV